MVKDTLFMTKILYIISDKNFGGGSRHVFDLITNLDKKKFKPVLVTIPSKIEILLKNKCTVYEVDMKSRLDLQAVSKIKEIILKEKPEIIHLHSTRAGILGTLAARNIGIPIIYTEHLFTKDYLPHNKIIHALQMQVLKRLSKNIAKVIAVSQSVKDYLAQNKIFQDNKIEVIYNGIQLSNKPYAISHKQKKEIIIGSIGTLTELKGYKYLIEALKIACPEYGRGENWKLEIIGSGEDEQKLKSLTKKYNLENSIIFTSFTSDIENKIAKWDIYIQPSLSESFGLAIAQAMDLGIPVIASRTGGIPELVDNNSGILVTPKNPEALSSAIIKLAQDEKLRNKMGLSARERIKKYFSLEIMINKTEKLYSETARNVA